MRSVCAVVFDAVGTLIHPDPSPAVVYAEVGARFGSRLTPADIAPRFAAAFAREEEADRLGGLRTSESREIRRWQAIVAAVLDDVSDPAGCFQELFDHFARSHAWRCEPETGPVLRRLSDLGFRLALASNYDSRLRSVAAGLPALARVRHLVISSEIGWRKPAAEFFSIVGRAVGVPPNQVLYVGDDYQNDYAGASAAGLQALLFDPGEKYSGSGVARIGRLGDLLQ